MLDVLALRVKTGISHVALRPKLAIVDPRLTVTQPTMVTAASGMDILCHALESYTARWYADFDAKEPEDRVPYCGANPIADLWSEQARDPPGHQSRSRYMIEPKQQGVDGRHEPGAEQEGPVLHRDQRVAGGERAPVSASRCRRRPGGACRRPGR